VAVPGVLESALIQAADVSLNPNAGGALGEGQIQKLLNLGAKYALLAALAGFVLGAGQWAWAKHNNNFSQGAGGLDRMKVSIGAAIAIGAAAAVINFFFDLGSGIK
jgi:hypothetical protein